MIDLRKILLYSGALISVLVIILTLSGISRKSDRIEKRLSEEFSANNSRIEMIRQNLIKIGSDLGQTRSMLGLPENDYLLDPENDIKGNTSGESYSDNSVYFRSFEILKNHFTEIELLKKLSFIADSGVFKAATSKNNLEIIQDNCDLRLKDSITGNTLIVFSADNVENSIIAEPLFRSAGRKVLKDISPETASVYINENIDEIKQLNNKLENYKQAVSNLISDNTVKGFLNRHKLYLDSYTSTERKTSVKIKRNSGSSVAEIILDHSDLTFSFCGNIYNDINKLKTDILSIEKICDIRTSDEKRIDQSMNDLQNLLNDESFVSYLADKGYRLSEKTREDNDYFYYDILSLDDNSKIGSYAVHKVSGDIYLTDHEEIPISSIQSFNSIKKKN